MSYLWNRYVAGVLRALDQVIKVKGYANDLLLGQRLSKLAALEHRG